MNKMSIIEKAIKKLNEGNSLAKDNIGLNLQGEQQSKTGEAGAQNQQQAPAQTAIPQEVSDTVDSSVTDTANKRVTMDNEFEVEKLSVSGLLMPDQTVPHLADEMRRIKRPLIANAFGKGTRLVDRGNIVMVTSAIPGEGKSFTAANLAVSIALEKDVTVMLVDADMTMSKITKMFALESAAGLTDLLNDSRLDVAKAIVKTDFPTLSVIPSGHRSVNSAELLSSNDMGKLVTELGQRYNNRMIIFDSPPLLPTSEAAILAEQMGQILLVVESNKTPKQAVLDAIKMLNKDKAIGLVLNKTRRSLAYGQYGGY